MAGPYPETVESGHRWLGRVPVHWRISPLGAHFDERSETVSDQDFPPLSVTKDGVVPQMANVAKTDNGGNRKLVRAGDFAINSRSDRKGSAGLSAFNGSTSVVYTVLVPRPSVDGRFIHHLLRSLAFQEEFYRWGNGIVADLWSTRYAAMKRIPLAVPPLPEQRAIADYLDRETARIDTLIEEQQRLIDTLRGRRKAIVEQAVFSGLEGAPRRDNAEPWLPPTPTHWRVVQLGFASDTLAGYAFSSDGFSAKEDHVRLLRGVNVKPGRIDWADTVYWDVEAAPVPSVFVLEAGDLVFGMDRPFVGGGVRVAAISGDDAPALLLQRVMRIRPNDEAGRGYMRYVMSTDAFSNYLEPLFTGVSVPHVSEWQVRKFKMPFPPRDEQKRISAYLNEKIAKIDALIEESQRFVELVRERRAALVTAVVTGQIDVPAVA
jgi:type I restriction enzyme S subunit